MQAKLNELDRIRADIQRENICPDLAKQATNLVMGDGNPDADIVFIGEAPGKREDIEGLPFVGASGKFLNEMLASIGLSRSDVYITNIVKYRPPENRDPSSSEKTEFMPYLQRQLEVINPKLIVTLGRHSANCFDSKLKISDQHGLLSEMELNFTNVGTKSYKVGFLPLYHPAAALYNGKMRSVLMEDFAKIPSLIKKIK